MLLPGALRDDTKNSCVGGALRDDTKNCCVADYMILLDLLCKHWYTSSVWNFCCWIWRPDIPHGEISLAARCMFRRLVDALIYVYTQKHILGLHTRDKAAMLGVKTKEYFLEEFTWK